jgi:hypothetical protein
MCHVPVWCVEECEASVEWTSVAVWCGVVVWGGMSVVVTSYAQQQLAGPRGATQ